jgi:hypothetical protein
MLWVRPLEASSAQVLAGTENAQAPFWSADSKSIGYFANAKLYKIDAGGGRPQALCDAEPSGGTWNAQGVILFGGADGLHRIGSDGGTPVLATKVDPKEEGHLALLPSDGRHFIFDAERTEDHNIRLGTLTGRIFCFRRSTYCLLSNFCQSGFPGGTIRCWQPEGRNRIVHAGSTNSEGRTTN